MSSCLLRLAFASWIAVLCVRTHPGEPGHPPAPSASLSDRVPAPDPSPLHAGFLYDQFPLTLGDGFRTEALGPFYSRQFEWPPVLPLKGAMTNAPPSDPVQRAAETLALSPFFSWHREARVDAVSWDFAYPLLTYDRYGPHYRWQLIQLFSVSGGQSTLGSDAKIVSVFPFYFERRSTDPAENYRAVFPFYGTMQKRFFRDEVEFVMWPVYARTRKKDVVTDNYLVPFFHVRRGEGLQGWQFWPLVGKEHKTLTTGTNLFGEPRVVGGRDAFFLLWPFYFRNDVETGTTNEVHQRVLLPFYSFQLSAARDQRTYLWPLGPTLVTDRVEGWRQVGVPWPFLVFARGEGKHTDRVFPFFSHTRYPNVESTSYLWPLYRHKHAVSAPLDREQVRILFYLYSDITERNLQTGKAARRTDLWPLFAARRDAEGNERFQMLAVFEPVLGANRSIARNFSPIWSVWREETNAKQGTRSRSLLWNLYREERAPDRRKCSLLFGLIQYQRGPDGVQWRWLHCLGSKAAKADRTHVPEHR